MTILIRARRFAGRSAIAFIIGYTMIANPLLASELGSTGVRSAGEEVLSTLPDNYYTIRVKQADKEISTGVPILIDVREPAEFAAEHIRGAKNIPLGRLAKQIESLPTDRSAPILVYCKSGHRGAMGLTVLLMLGYKNVHSIYGGIVGWKAAGFPVQK